MGAGAAYAVWQQLALLSGHFRLLIRHHALNPVISGLPVAIERWVVPT